MSGENFIDKHVGGRLRALREARGLKADALAGWGGLSMERLEAAGKRSSRSLSSGQ